MSGVVIAIDGPSASGKSSTARAVAEALGFTHLDSGALYRGVTLVALREATRQDHPTCDPLQVLTPEAILRAAEHGGLTLRPEGPSFGAYLEGEPVDQEIRGPEVTAQVSAVSAAPLIREWVNTHLRAIVKAGRDVVVDGRDIGTVVFPNADLKIFLTATPETRAGRRLIQRGDTEVSTRLEEETATLNARDHADSTRPVAPLCQAEDAVVLDTTKLTFKEQVERILQLAHKVLPRP